MRCWQLMCPMSHGVVRATAGRLLFCKLQAASCKLQAARSKPVSDRGGCSSLTAATTLYCWGAAHITIIPQGCYCSRVWTEGHAAALTALACMEPQPDLAIVLAVLTCWQDSARCRSVCHSLSGPFVSKTRLRSAQKCCTAFPQPAQHLVASEHKAMEQGRARSSPGVYRCQA